MLTTTLSTSVAADDVWGNAEVAEGGATDHVERPAGFAFGAGSDQVGW
jgi:hypothetical protein